MALHWDISAVRDYKEVNGNPGRPDEINPVLHFLIFAMMPIGMRGITEKNKDKVFERLSIYQRMTGCAVEFGDGTELYVTKEDVERYVGLSVNVSEESDAWFAKSVRRWATGDYAVTTYDNPDKMTALAYLEHRAKEKKNA